LFTPIEGVFVIEQLKPIDLGILIAAAVMGLGAFCPIITLPIIGSLNYVMRGNGDGIIIVGCSAAIITLAICGYRRTTALFAAGALVTMVVTLSELAAILIKAQAQAARSAKSDPFGGLASLMMSSVGLGWGWVLLFGGAIGVLILALLSSPQTAPSTDARTADPDAESFSSADKVIAEYLNNRSISPAIRNAGKQSGFGKRAQPN
jgi:hypothetical protein